MDPKSGKSAVGCPWNISATIAPLGIIAILVTVCFIGMRSGCDFHLISSLAACVTTLDAMRDSLQERDFQISRNFDTSKSYVKNM